MCQTGNHKRNDPIEKESGNMKAFTVFFDTGFPVSKCAEDQEQAIILAKADRINHNLPYKTVIKIREDPYSEGGEAE